MKLSDLDKHNLQMYGPRAAELLEDVTDAVLEAAHETRRPVWKAAYEWSVSYAPYNKNVWDIADCAEQDVMRRPIKDVDGIYNPHTPNDDANPGVNDDDDLWDVMNRQVRAFLYDLFMAVAAETGLWNTD